MNKQELQNKFNAQIKSIESDLGTNGINLHSGTRLSVSKAVQELSMMVQDFQDLGHDVSIDILGRTGDLWKADYARYKTNIFSGFLNIGVQKHYFSMFFDYEKRAILYSMSSGDVRLIGNTATKTSNAWAIENAFEYNDFTIEGFDGLHSLQGSILNKLAHQKWIENNDVSNSFNKEDAKIKKMNKGSLKLGNKG